MQDKSIEPDKKCIQCPGLLSYVLVSLLPDGIMWKAEWESPNQAKEDCLFPLKLSIWQCTSLAEGLMLIFTSAKWSLASQKSSARWGEHFVAALKGPCNNKFVLPAMAVCCSSAGHSSPWQCLTSNLSLWKSLKTCTWCNENGCVGKWSGVKKYLYGMPWVTSFSFRKSMWGTQRQWLIWK